MLEELIGQEVIVDLRSPFVCLGTLLRINDQFLDHGACSLYADSTSEPDRETLLCPACLPLNDSITMHWSD